MTKDTRIVVGARCTWWDSIDKVSTRQGLPVCPHCSNVLYEFESKEEWDQSVQAHEDNGNPGYKAQVDWSRGKCFPSYQAMQAAYKKEALH